MFGCKLSVSFFTVFACKFLLAHCLSGAEITTVPAIMAYVCKVPPPAYFLTLYLLLCVRLVSQDSVQSTDAATRALLPLGAKPKSMEEEQLSWGPYIPERLL